MTSRFWRVLPALILSLCLLMLPGAVSAAKPRPPQPTFATVDDGVLSSFVSQLLTPSRFTRIESRVSVGCDDLVSPTELSDAMGVSESEISVVEDQFLEIWAAAGIQAGMLSCDWTGPSRGWTEGPQSHEIGPARAWIHVLPDAGADFHAFSDYFDPTQWGGAEYPTIGDLMGVGSWTSCFVNQLDRTCYGEFETDDYWVDYLFSGPVPFGTQDGTSTDPAVRFATSAQSALSAGNPPSPRYRTPAGSLGPWESCALIDADGAIRAIVGSPSLPAPPDDEEDAFRPNERDEVALESVEFVSCGWNQPAEYSDGSEPEIPLDEILELRLALLPGGEWAWPEVRMSTLAVSPRANGASAEVVLPDGSNAVVVCFINQICQADVLIQHSLVSISYSYRYRQSNPPSDEVLVAEGLQFLPALLDHLKAHSRTGD